MRRSYTITYALLGDLALIILIGTGSLLPFIGFMAGVSSLLLVPLILVTFYVVKANAVAFWQRSVFSQRDCVISAAVGAGIPALLWLLVLLILAALGADIG